MKTNPFLILALTSIFDLQENLLMKAYKEVCEATSELDEWDDYDLGDICTELGYQVWASKESHPARGFKEYVKLLATGKKLDFEFILEKTTFTQVKHDDGDEHGIYFSTETPKEGEDMWRYCRRSNKINIEDHTFKDTHPDIESWNTIELREFLFDAGEYGDLESVPTDRSALLDEVQEYMDKNFN